MCAHPLWLRVYTLLLFLSIVLYGIRSIFIFFIYFAQIQLG